MISDGELIDKEKKFMYRHELGIHTTNWLLDIDRQISFRSLLDRLAVNETGMLFLHAPSHLLLATADYNRRISFNYLLYHRKEIAGYIARYYS